MEEGREAEREGKREGGRKRGRNKGGKGRRGGRGKREVSPFLLRVPCLYSSLQQTRTLALSFLQKPRVVARKSR